MWSDAPLPVLRVQSEATSPWHQPLRVEAVVLPLCLSLCVTPLRHKEPQSGLIIFGLFYSLRLWTGASTLPHKQPHTDVITDVKKKKKHTPFMIRLLIAFQHRSTVRWNAQRSSCRLWRQTWISYMIISVDRHFNMKVAMWVWVNMHVAFLGRSSL